MFLIAAALSQFFFADPSPAYVQTRYALAGWRISVNRDTFTAAVSCSLSGPEMRFKAGTLIFSLGKGVETTHAVYRLDGGAPAPVSATFREDAANGFFPERGWIDDPAGGEVALPASRLKGVKRLWIRASPDYLPRYFNISRFGEALAGAKAAGCPDNGFGAAAL
jgi:hypothetical protein